MLTSLLFMLANKLTSSANAIVLQYAMTAIERYGAWKGGRMAAWRLLRCNPFSKGGYDPVPEDPCITLRRE